MCVKQGKRCKYADEMAVIRRKYRRQNPNISGREMLKKVEKELESRPELAWHEATKNTSFQWTPPSWSVPHSLTKDMPKVGQLPESTPTAKELYEQNEQWWENMDEDEQNAVSSYVMNGYLPVNGILRGRSEWKKDFPFRKEEWPEHMSQFKKNIAFLDSAMEKAPATRRDQPLYRYYRIPAGVNRKEYIEKVLTVSGGHKDKAFMSTTANPLHALAQMYKKNQRHSKRGLDDYVLLEIWTNQGASLQQEEEARVGDIQSQEHEVLLPRNTGLRFIESGTLRHTFEETPVELQTTFGGTMRSVVGRKLSVPVIRMIDEKLIREERNRVS